MTAGYALPGACTLILIFPSRQLSDFGRCAVSMAMYVLNLASLLFLVVSAIATAVPRAPELVDKRQTFNCQYPGSQAGNSGIGKHNDFTCKSTSHPNPVVLLHGLGATYYEGTSITPRVTQVSPDQIQT